MRTKGSCPRFLGIEPILGRKSADIFSCLTEYALEENVGFGDGLFNRPASTLDLVEPFVIVWVLEKLLSVQQTWEGNRLDHNVDSFQIIC